MFGRTRISRDESGRARGVHAQANAFNGTLSLLPSMEPETKKATVLDRHYLIQSRFQHYLHRGAIAFHFVMVQHIDNASRESLEFPFLVHRKWSNRIGSGVRIFIIIRERIRFREFARWRTNMRALDTLQDTQQACIHDSLDPFYAIQRVIITRQWKPCICLLYTSPSPRD